MIFQLTFKTPEVEDQIENPLSLEIENILAKYIEYGEYITIEFNTESNIATVVEL